MHRKRTCHAQDADVSTGRGSVLHRSRKCHAQDEEFSCTGRGRVMHRARTCHAQSEDVSCTGRGSTYRKQDADVRIVYKGWIVHRTRISRALYAEASYTRTGASSQVSRSLSSHSGRPTVPRRSGCSNITELLLFAARISLPCCTCHHCILYLCYCTLLLLLLLDPVRVLHQSKNNQIAQNSVFFSPRSYHSITGSYSPKGSYGQEMLLSDGYWYRKIITFLADNENLVVFSLITFHELRLSHYLSHVFCLISPRFITATYRGQTYPSGVCFDIPLFRPSPYREHDSSFLLPFRFAGTRTPST